MYRIAGCLSLRGWAAGCAVAFVCLLLAVVAPASTCLPGFRATTLTWDLEGVTFVAGGSATGSITIQVCENELRDEADETVTKTITNFDVTISGLPDDVPTTIFNPGNASATITGDPIFDLLQNDPNQFNFTTPPLFEDGGTVDISSGFFSDPSVDLTFDLAPGGSLTTTVPEPSTWTLLGAGALLLALAWRRRSAMIG